jgi:hypothetical protein
MSIVRFTLTSHLDGPAQHVSKSEKRRNANQLSRAPCYNEAGGYIMLSLVLAMRSINGILPLKQHTYMIRLYTVAFIKPSRFNGEMAERSKALA